MHLCTQKELYIVLAAPCGFARVASDPVGNSGWKVA